MSDLWDTTAAITGTTIYKIQTIVQGTEYRYKVQGQPQEDTTAIVLKVEWF